MNENERHAAIFAAALVIMIALCIVGIISALDFSGPILSERNPNGTVDYWYLFDRADHVR